MFSKILIANRGEIACRVMKTARRMGIATVAVHSDADARALHVQMADEAVRIGEAPSVDSYLRADRILDAIKSTGADAVHPGYGFLSENAEFSKSLADAGVAFIGPGERAITSMGDKITSKRIAADAGVSTIPGYEGVIDGPDHAVTIAGEIGYPVMLKASAGGGGKGMRVVRDEQECRDGFDSASSEARSSFGDDRMLAEKFIEQPRHIEIQVMADNHGNAVYLGERECSIQRRHQKVVEEAPSPFLDAATRQAMGEQAVALAKAVDYSSAGTVEFIVDAKRNFYFLEMNTRLRVERLVAELVPGLDLVELMIRVAAGEELPLAQEDVTLNGWAVEARVYAEAPFRNFLRSIGRLVRYRPPEESESVRVDTGIVEGSEVSMYYDPMIAKLCTWGADRPQAIERMNDALDAYLIRGVSHNVSFLNAVIANPRFRAGRLTTEFIAEEFPDGFRPADLPRTDPMTVVAVAAVVHCRRAARAGEISGQTRRFEYRVGRDWVVIANGEHYPVEVAATLDGFDVRSNGNLYRIETAWRLDEPIVEAKVNGTAVRVQVDREGAGYRLYHRGTEVDALVVSPAGATLAGHMLEKVPPDLSRFLLSPMPGLLVRLSVQEGQEAKAGEELAVVEAMKMENSLRAADDVTVKKVLAKMGESLEVDQPILEFE
ncbi:MAG: acetyl/propionyl/methylcrotonyl-CoA carboxylase subunit alpha [Gammaproteobacteria bacterium]|nr:acetyl/propionyl/methylcrotonyl-CoA carboxylase subunit alpha [Gammaproteobacteria bacterium]